MTTLVIAAVLWVALVHVSSLILYAVAQRDLAEARRLREEVVRSCTPEFSEAELTSYGVAVALAMREKEGAPLQVIH